VSDRWIYSVIRHSRRFSASEALICSLMCNVNVVNRISCFCLIILFSEWTGVALATLATSLSRTYKTEGRAVYIQSVRATFRLVENATADDISQNLFIGQTLVRLFRQRHHLPENHTVRPTRQKKNTKFST